MNRPKRTAGLEGLPEEERKPAVAGWVRAGRVGAH